MAIKYVYWKNTKLNLPVYDQSEKIIKMQKYTTKRDFAKGKEAPLPTENMRNAGDDMFQEDYDAAMERQDKLNLSIKNKMMGKNNLVIQN